MASDATPDARGEIGRRAPGPDGLPAVGNLHRYLRDPLGFVERCAEEYGDVVATNVGTADSHMLVHPEHVERVLVTEDHRFRKAELGQGRLEPLFGNGLVVSDGEYWRRQRTRMQPAFRPDRIATYAEIMGERAAATAEEWERGETIDVTEEMRRLTLSVLVRSLFGTDLGALEAEIREAFTMAMGRFEGANMWLPGWLPTPANRRFERGRERLDEIVSALIESRRETAADRDDLLSTLLVAEDERGEGMSDEGVRDEVVTLLAAGHDTTALALTYAWHLLGTNPDAAARLREELDALDGEPPTLADLSDLEYTGAVVSEALRLYPPTHATAREPTEDVTFDGYVVPAGEPVFLPQWIVHRDGRWWDDPESFRPERWLDDDPDRPEYAYFPFGGGPRHCLGHRFATVEAQVVLATLAPRWDLEPLASELSLRPVITLRPTEPVEAIVCEP
ncbi:cytochrome P450 [Salinilacihabitans rarus]|uniref:cytochrome P450 n=1 Tax=Salinilacihabitans rarus TaxID=2961596 RepID=UPI0020C8E6C2|nr:cytochrome P450 [Salinilacihabitans rarus]